ncbi:helix-turn-helix domain-containing protein [Clostridium chrysemydis]|uniref:helix-turn-helix domain-containing protein n=1 Tax=Clostridium chrysemydis TaxID=2665504 RepID=UPI0018836B26|nr:helix-turn-helix domain-containing protein [Clostridium chrysemydis]
MSKARVINMNNAKIKKRLIEKKNFIMIDNDFRREIVKSCGASALVVYLELESRLNTKTGLCCPAILEISNSTGLGERTVKRALKQLKEARFLDWVSVKSKNNAFKNNEYFFMYPSITSSQVEVEEVNETVEEIKPVETVQQHMQKVGPVMSAKLNAELLRKMPPPMTPKIKEMISKKEEPKVEQLNENRAITKEEEVKLISRLIKKINDIEPDTISQSKIQQIKSYVKNENGYVAEAKKLNDKIQSLAIISYYDWEEDRHVKQIRKGCEKVFQIDLDKNTIITVETEIRKKAIA